VDNYGGGFIRVGAGAVTTSTTATVALATTPGPGGAIYPGLNDVPGTAAVWADFSGTLGHVRTAAGADVLGNTLKQWIRQGTVLTVHRDNADPAHPNLIVDQVTNPTPAGSSLALDDLRDVTAPAATPAGKVLGTTATGQWGAVDGLPSPRPPAAPYTYHTAGVQTAGQAVYLQGYVAVHETDTAGVDHDWGHVLKPGSGFRFAGATFHAQLVNLSDGVLPQMMIDTFVASGICMIKPVEPLPAAPADGTAATFQPLWDGKLLGVQGDAWAAVDPPSGGPADGSTDNGILVWDATAGAWVPDDGGGVDIASALLVHKYLSIRTTFRDIPSAPANGDIWVAGSKIMMQTGGQAYDVTRVALDSMVDVDAPMDTPAGKVLGTTAEGTWGPVAPFWSGTQAAYDAIATKDPNTLYVITG
jgi:hypothetical protein